MHYLLNACTPFKWKQYDVFKILILILFKVFVDTIKRKLNEKNHLITIGQNYSH